MSEFSSGPIIIPKGFNRWEGFAADLELGTPDSCLDAYESKKLAGAVEMPQQREMFLAEAKQASGYSYLGDAAHANGWADSGKGKLVIPFVHVLEAYPKALPGPAQVVGDCVAHSQKNANLLSMVCEVVSGKRDEEHGKAERFPEVSALGEKNGVLSTEAIYWHRGYSSHGWFCGASARVSMQKAGCVLRKPYPEINIDLTKYSGSNIAKFGSRKPTREVVDAHNNNLVRAAAQARSFAEIRDALYNGYGVSSCGSEGFERKRDSYGVSRRTTTWQHAMKYGAVDERPVIVQRYDQPLVLLVNSWAAWNSGPRDIFDSAKYVPADKKQDWISKGIVNPSTGNIMIPHGAFWARWSEVSRRDCYVMSSVNGWPRRNIEWGTSLLG